MLHTVDPSVSVEPTLRAHLDSYLVQNIRFSHEMKSYTYRERHIHGPIQVGGLVNHLKRVHYPHHAAKSTKRRRMTLAKGSSSKQGKEIDAQLSGAFARAPTHRMAIAVLEYLASRGQTLHACQVPCWIAPFKAITQADLIAIDTRGKLHL